MAGAIMTPSEPPKHDALLRLFAKIEQDPITVHEALEDIRAVSGENIRKDIEGLEIRMTARFDTTEARFDTTDAHIGALRTWVTARIDTIDARFDTTDAHIGALRTWVTARIDTIDARFDTTDARLDGLQREISSLRWMIGVGFTLLSIFIALSTFLGG